MLSNEPIKNIVDYYVQYDVIFLKNGVETELVKGRKVKGNDLVFLLWKLIPAVYLQMKNRKENTWNDLACYMKDELSERISTDVFWIGSMNKGADTSIFLDKRINIRSMIMDEDHIDLVFASSTDLKGNDYLEGISSLIQKTYSVLLSEDSTSAEWLKQSLSTLVQMDAFWNEGVVSDEMADKLRTEFYNRYQRFS